jgi:hypothetical protein
MADPEPKAAYQVVIASHDPAITEQDIRDAFSQNAGAIEQELTRRAVLRLGPAWTASVRQPTAATGAQAEVLLAVRYPVREDATSLEELRNFAADIQEAIEPALQISNLGVVAGLDATSVVGSSAAVEKPSWDRIAPVLAAVATGIGVLGFVTFVGGAIIFARFTAAGIPPEVALSAVPPHDMVVIGARTIVPAIGWALAACIFYLGFDFWDGKRQGRPRPSSKPRRAASFLNRNTRAFGVAGIVAVFMAVEIGTTIPVGSLYWLDWLWIVALGAVAIAATVLIAYRFEKFLYVAAAIFLSLSIAIGLIDYIHAKDGAKLRGSAVIRGNDEVIAGYFVAEGSDRVYLARIDRVPQIENGRIKKSDSRLIAIDSSQVNAIAIGPSKRPKPAASQARRLASELCGLQPPPASGSGPSRSIGRRLGYEAWECR